MSRIYLEEKPVTFGIDTGYVHLYLVKRPDPLPGQLDSLAWRQSGEVLRGGSQGGFGTLVVQSGPLSGSDDRYTSQDDVGARGLFDITDRVGGEAGWALMAAALNTIAANGYSYELPFGRIDSMDHVINSNATVASILNSVGVDVRSMIVGSDTRIPGASVNDTLLAIYGTNMPPPSATGGVTMVGQAHREYFFLSNQFSNRFYGSQRFDNSIGYSTVSYQGVTGGVTMTLDAFGSFPSQVTVAKSGGRAGCNREQGLPLGGREHMGSGSSGSAA